MKNIDRRVIIVILINILLGGFMKTEFYKTQAGDNRRAIGGGRMKDGTIGGGRMEDGAIGGRMEDGAIGGEGKENCNFSLSLTRSI